MYKVMEKWDEEWDGGVEEGVKMEMGVKFKDGELKECVK